MPARTNRRPSPVASSNSLPHPPPLTPNEGWSCRLWKGKATWAGRSRGLGVLPYPVPRHSKTIKTKLHSVQFMVSTRCITNFSFIRDTMKSPRNEQFQRTCPSLHAASTIILEPPHPSGRLLLLGLLTSSHHRAVCKFIKAATLKDH